MSELPRLYAHPFSSYSRKVLIALYEHGTPFEYRSLEEPTAREELAALWPLRRYPVLVDRGRTVLEATCIIEYLDLHHPGPRRLLPADAEAALDVRMLDRVFDNCVSTPQQKVVFDALRPGDRRDAYVVAEARAMLETADAWLDRRMTGRDRPPAGASAWPTAPPRRSCSTPTGPTRSTRASSTCAPTAPACWRALPPPASWTRRAPSPRLPARRARPRPSHRLEPSP
ncbi:glutathione S-transferase family protein [Fulvimonas yonginensis]|uniref:Glutathione S-transferase family protein n=1 Tax=Fulvimonas yonginensis TaxID=1495200 RepID=A0ABU8JDM9_9GAMM